MKTMIITTKKKETEKNVETKPKKLSPAGEWMRKHPHGQGGVVIIIANKN